MNDRIIKKEVNGMGSRGSKSGRVVKTGPQQYEGKSVTELKDITRSNMEEKLGLKNLSDGQKSAIMDIIRGLQEYDYTPTEGGKIPSVIDSITIEQPFIDKDYMRGQRYDVSVYIRTKGNTGNHTIDFLDTKYHGPALIGRKGGIFTYKGRTKTNVRWDTIYGKRNTY